MTSTLSDLALVPSADQEELRHTLRRFLSERSTEADVRRVMASETGVDEAVWQGLTDIGVPGLAVPEEHGGAGWGFAELAVVLEEAGRAVLPAPLLSSVVMATFTLLALDDPEAHRRLLPPMAEGRRRAALVLPRSPRDVRVDDAGRTAHLTGRCAGVLDAGTAHDLLVVTDGPAGRSLHAVDAAAPGVRITPAQPLDQTRPMATVELECAPASLIGEPGGAAPAVERGLACGRVALACDAVGGGDAVLAAAVSYALQRRQFGRLIGSFQAVKHLCADALTEVEPGRAAAAYAARVIDSHDPEELAVATAVAKSWCCDAYVHAAGINLQVHGGIGFTWEHSAHLFLKRAKSNQLLLGDGHAQRAALAQALGLDA